MIPSSVWQNWKDIFSMVINLLMSNVITSFFFASVVIEIVANLIYRIASSRGENAS